MVVEDLTVGIISTAWCVREAKRQSLASEEWLGVWELSTLEEDRFLVINSANDVMSSLSNRVKDSFIELVRLEK